MISVILRLEFIKIAKRYGFYDIYFVFACVLLTQRIEIRVREGSQKIPLAELQHFNHFFTLSSFELFFFFYFLIEVSEHFAYGFGVSKTLGVIFQNILDDGRFAFRYNAHKRRLFGFCV